jgi:hypothetical protein
MNPSQMLLRKAQIERSRFEDEALESRRADRRARRQGVELRPSIFSLLRRR